MANSTTLVLTIGLLIVPILLLGRDWMPKWIHRVPFAIISLAVLFRIYAFWTIDLTDAQVAGYLPEHVTGMSTILHIFDGPAGLMLGLLLGFSAGFALCEPDVNESRWITLFWLLLLGWGVDSEGFTTITATSLTDQSSILDWYSAVYPLLGLGLSIVAIPTLVNIENATTPSLIATFCIGFVFLDISSSPVAWMLLSLIAHRISSLRIHSSRGVATQRRWSGLMLTFFLSSASIVIGLSWLAMPDEFWNALWFSRLAVGWILLCGIAGALTPTMGYDASPRPEAWGFHTGVILAPALLPGLTLIAYAQLPILIIAIVMPILATLPEHRPQIDWKRRGLEGLVLFSILPFSLLGTNFIPVSLIVIIVTLPLLIHLKHSVDEEE
ncbi:MAG: hypothetical protein OSB33_01360 [Candidatus Poseidoniales archaeon]|nr:hypothetical protein [Candidatus Poseidoniales archaeon]